MDPQVKSVLTSLGMAAATAVASWAAAKGFVSSDQQAGLVNALLTVGAAAVAAGLGWYKSHMVSQKSMIQAVNAADNGVKVVASTEQAMPVSAPLK